MRMSLFPNQASQSEPRYTATQIRTAFEDSNHQGEFFQLINEIASSAEYKVDAMREELEPVWEELLTRMPNAKYLSDEISELKSHQFSEQLSDEGSMRFTARHPFEVIAGLVLFSGAWNFTQLASNTELSETDRAVYSADARFWLIRGVKYNDFFCIDNKSKTLREAILSTDEKGNGIITDTDIEQLDEYNQQAIQYHGSVGMLLAAANYCCLVKYFIRAIKRTADSKGIGIAGLFAQEPEAKLFRPKLQSYVRKMLYYAKLAELFSPYCEDIIINVGSLGSLQCWQKSCQTFEDHLRFYQDLGRLPFKGSESEVAPVLEEAENTLRTYIQSTEFGYSRGAG